MRLSRGTSLPASIVARQATSRVAVAVEQGCQHLSTDSQAVVCQRLLLTFCGKRSSSVSNKRRFVVSLVLSESGLGYPRKAPPVAAPDTGADLWNAQILCHVWYGCTIHRQRRHREPWGKPSAPPSPRLS